MKLYFKSGACSLAPHIALEEAGLAYTSVAVDLATKKTADGADYLAINPKGYVPALSLSSTGMVLTEVPAILQYIADQSPSQALAPANGSMQRYQLQSWLNFIATEVHKNIGPFFNPNAGEAWLQGVTANLQRRLPVIEAELGKHEYLNGEYSIADIYLFTVLGWAPVAKLDLSPYKNIAAWQQRVAARPAVQRALQAEGLV